MRISASSLTIINDSIDGLGAYGTALKYCSLVIHFVFNFVPFLINLFFTLTATNIYATYFAPWRTDCVHEPALGYNRWIILSYIVVNFYDNWFSFFVGQKMIGQIVLVFIGIAGLVNFGLFGTMLLIWHLLFPCNNPNNSVFRNWCTNPDVCGRSEFIADSRSDCSYINPNGYPLSPTDEPLMWNPVYLTFFITLCITIAFNAVKFILVFLIPESTTLARKTVVTGLKIFENLKEGKLVIPTAEKGGTKKVNTKTKEVPLSKLPFMAGWEAWQKVAYWIFAIFHLLASLWYVFYAGWILPQTRTTNKGLTEAVVGVTNAVIITGPGIGYRFLYYTMVTANIFPIFMCAVIGFFGLNWIAVLGSVIGIAINGVVLISNIVQLGWCSTFGLVLNLCMDNLFRCQDPMTTMDPTCTNSYSCGTQVPHRGPNTEFILLFIMISYLFLQYLFGLFLSISIGKSLNKLKIKQ